MKEYFSDAPKGLNLNNRGFLTRGLSKNSQPVTAGGELQYADANNFQRVVFSVWFTHFLRWIVCFRGIVRPRSGAENVFICKPRVRNPRLLRFNPIRGNEFSLQILQEQIEEENAKKQSAQQPE